MFKPGDVVEYRGAYADYQGLPALILGKEDDMGIYDVGIRGRFLRVHRTWLRPILPKTYFDLFGDRRWETHFSVFFTR